MRKQSFEYFNGQPGYVLMTAPKVYERVLKGWLNCESLTDICKALLSDKIGIESIVGFKKYLSLIISTDLNDDKLTREIVLGFIDYIESIYAILDDDTDAKTYWDKNPHLFNVYYNTIKQNAAERVKI